MTPHGGSVAPALVGRDADLRLIAQRLAAAAKGRGSALTIEADPGLGKTALVDTAAARAERATVLWCRGTQAEIELPYSGLHALLRPLLDDAPLAPDPRAALESALSLGTDTPLSTVAIGMAALELVSAVASRQRPLLLIFDDFQWLDAESAAVARFLADRIEHDPVVLLSTARPTADLEAPGDHVTLSTLDITAVGDLAGQLVGRPVHTKIAESLHRATGGNPLAVIEVVREFDLDRFGSELDELPATEVIRRTFAQRVAHLSEGAREALLVVALSLDPSTPVILRALETLAFPTTDLDEAADAGVITIDADTVRFSHPLLEAVVNDAGTPTLRRRVHRALAATITDEVSSAWHAAAGCRNTDAAVAAQLAAAAAELARRGGGVGAAVAFERAGQLQPDGAIAAQYFFDAGEEARRAGRIEWAASLLEAASTRSDDPNLTGRITYQLATIDGWSGKNAHLGDRYVEAAEILESVDIDDALTVWDDTLVEFVLDGEVDRAVALAPHVEQLAESAGKPLVAHAVPYVRLIAGIDPARSKADLIAHARAAIADPDHRAYSTIEACAWIGETELAVELGDALARARDANREHDEAVGDAYDGILRWALGDWSGALVAFERAREHGRAGGEDWAVRMVTAYQAIIRGCRGEALVEQLVEEIKASLGGGSHPLVIPAMASALGSYELASARPERAIVHLEAAEAWCRDARYVEPTIFPWPAELVEAYAGAGRAADARAALERFRRVAKLTARPSALAAVARLDGLLHRGDDFDPYFITALEVQDAAASPYEAARTRLIYARRLRRAGRRREATDVLEAAEAGFRRLRAEGWLRRVEAERLGDDAEADTAATASPLARLTRQEIVVAECVAQGMRNKEIAAHLFLTVKTIEWYLRQIYRKLEIRSRVQLASYVNGR